MVMQAIKTNIVKFSVTISMILTLIIERVSFRFCIFTIHLISILQTGTKDQSFESRFSINSICIQYDLGSPRASHCTLIRQFKRHFIFTLHCKPCRDVFRHFVSYKQPKGQIKLQRTLKLVHVKIHEQLRQDR